MISRGIALGIALLVQVGGGARAATGPQCGAIEFLTAKQFTLVAGGSFLPVVQELDGTYSAYPHQPYAPYKRGTPIPNFQQQFAGCLPRAPNKTAGLTVKSRPAGAPGSGVLAIPDAGDGTPAGMWQTFYGDSIQVWQANPDFTFRTSTNYKVGQSRRATLSGDYNKDGKPDIAVLLQAYTYQGVNETSGVKVLPGKGDGTFGNSIFTALPGESPVGFAQADFNGDGRMDLAVAFYDSTVLILLGSGDGKFVAGTTFKTGSSLTNIGAADINGDGKADLQVLGTGPDRAYLYPGNGDGSFKTVVPIDLPATANYVIGTDLNADGIIDLVYSFTYSSTVGVALGKGNGAFGPLTSYLASNEPMTLIPADVDQDGHLDLIVGEGLPNAFVPTEQNGYVSVLFGRGDGTLISAVATATPGKIASFVMADINGDGRPDFIGLHRNSRPPTFTLVLRNESGGFQAPKTVNLVPGATYPYFSSVAAGDFDKDGKMDLAIGEQSGQGVWISSGNGDGTFRAAIRVALPAAVLALAAGDLNGDGRADLAVVLSGANDPTSLAFLLSQASGSFGSPRVVTLGQSLNQLALADMDGDKKLDLVAGDAGAYNDPKNPARVWVAKGNGDGTFQTARDYPLGVLGLAFTIGDANGDGLPDIAATSQGANFGWLLALLTNQGGGTFKPAILKTDFGPGPAAITDLNGDKIPDLVIPHCCGDTDMTYMVGNGDGTLQSEVHFTGGQNPTAVVAEDVNGDGKPDLLILGGAQFNNTGTLSTLINLSPSGADFKNVSGVSYVEMPLSPGSVAAAKGKDLATTFLQAPDSSDPQLSLNSTSVTIADADGNTYPARLFLID
ncbi:MAG: VCBS repeat-containing protein, partial [Acidobacteria bacterium]|nr:VCBS repeat-containing protein [Acidobacteriota bacterium]